MGSHTLSHKTKSYQISSKMEKILLVLLQVVFLCHCSPLIAEDTSYSLDKIKQVADYDSMCYTCSVTLVEANGNLKKYDTYKTGYIESAIKVTKNYAGPKIQYLVGAGLMKINSGETPLQSVDFNVLGAEASVHTSLLGAGYSATVKLAGGKASIFQLQLALGVSSELGIVDDSVAVRFLGLGGSIGRVNKICAFDTCFGFDLGGLFG